MTIPNSDEAALKKRKRALEGIIKRRGDTILLLRGELHRAEQELSTVKWRLAEYKKAPSRG